MFLKKIHILFLVSILNLVEATNVLYAQNDKDSINFKMPSLEEFANPFQNLNYISPRFSQVKNLDGSVQKTTLLRTVFTIPDLPIHFRVELPYSIYSDSNQFIKGLGDISLRSVFVFHQKNRILAAIALKTILSTASNSELGSGDFRFNPEVGFLKIFPKSKGSIGLSTEYLFSINQSKFGHPRSSILGLSPTLDYWGENFQIGYYPTYTYNFLTKQLSIPFDVEIGFKLYKSWWIRYELILPMGPYKASKYEFEIKLRCDF